MYNPTGPFISNPAPGFARLLAVTDENQTGFPFSRWLPTNQAVQWARDMNENSKGGRVVTFRVTHN